ncbi:MAG: glycosyltransferase family 4 protein [Anaerolineae bacterium]
MHYAARNTSAMLIGIDASRTVIADRTGTENYTLHLIRAMITQGSTHHFRLYFNAPPHGGLFPRTPQCSQSVIPWPRLWTHVRLSGELARHRPDVLFVPSHVLPLVCPVPGVVTVHDLGYLAYPEAHRRFDRWYLDWTTRRHTRVAAHLLADSEVTRQDLIWHYGADSNRITVVYPGLDPAFQPIDDPAQLAAVRSRYGIDSDYVIHLGTLQPRKNIGRLLDAFERLHNSKSEIRNSKLDLVLAGKPGWLAQDLVARVTAMGDQVRLIGHVEQSDLPALISGARALVMPSLYEGFGFPVLEAMACGTPVVASNVSSLPEVAGDAALLIDPHDTGAMAHALEHILTDDDLRADLRRRGLERARHFTWQRAAQQTLTVLENVVSNHRPPRFPYQ